jgi:hypothetical protein
MGRSIYLLKNDEYLSSKELQLAELSSGFYYITIEVNSSVIIEKIEILK